MTFISRLFKRKDDSTEYQVADAYAGLRKMLFATKSEQIGLKRGVEPGGIWGVVMETGYEKAVATLVALADGTVSLYFSNGGGFIGMGTKEGPKQAGRELLSEAVKFTDACKPTTLYPYPQKMHSRFFIFTEGAVLTIEGVDNDLGNYRHAVSPLFHAAHRLITEIRVAGEDVK